MHGNNKLLRFTRTESSSVTRKQENSSNFSMAKIFCWWWCQNTVGCTHQIPLEGSANNMSLSHWNNHFVALVPFWAIWPFETMIVTHDAFKSSLVMLCIFHAIWHPFKKDIYLVLPQKSGPDKPVELTDVVRTWGTSLVNISVPFLSTVLSPHVLFLPNYSWIPIWNFSTSSLCLSNMGSV